MSETILTAENLKFRYDAEQPVYALDGVSAQVKRGEFVAVLGANGCGKSTLAKHFNAILLPESGKVYVEGMEAPPQKRTVNSIFMDLMKNEENRAVLQPLLHQMAGGLGGTSDGEEGAISNQMLEAMLQYMPLRGLVSFSGGQISYEQLEALAQQLK